MTSIKINGRKCDLGRNSLNQSPGSNGTMHSDLREVQRGMAAGF